MEGEFSEVRRRANNKVNEEKIKKHMLNARGAADGQDDSSTKENALTKNTKPVTNTNKQVTPNTNNTAGCKSQNQEKPKVFGKDFLEAPIPKTNPWNKAKQDMPSDMENRSDYNLSEVVCSRNTNAAEISEVENATYRNREPDEINSDSESARKTYASPTKARASQKNAETGMVPAHNSHQAHNPANKTSNKSKFWDKKNKEQKQQQTDLNDSAQWPSLEYLSEKSKEQLAARPKCPQPKADESNNESDADSQTKPDSPTGDVIDNVNNPLATKKKNKQKWVQLPIELKTERRRGSGGSRGRGAPRPQYYEDQQRRNNRPTFRRPNKVRDGSRQGEETESRADESERNHVQTGPIRGNSFRGRRGRGRAGYPRMQRDSASLTIEEPVQPFFAPIFVADEADESSANLPEVRPEFTQTAIPQENYFETRIKLQIEYYFSEKNLEKDSYLRHHMDEAGWVDMNLICAFPRVKSLSDDKDNILNAIKRSTAIEVSEDGQRLRAAVEPQKWPLKPGVEIVDPHIPRWKALSSNSKLKADAPVFVPGQQYVPSSCAAMTKSNDECLHKQISTDTFQLGKVEDK